MSSPGTGGQRISLVTVAAPDQDRAVEFHVSVGFEESTGTPSGSGYRWIEG